MLELGVRKPSRKLVCKIESLGNSSLPGAQVVSDGELAAEVVGKCEPAHDKRISYAEGLDEKSVRVSESADTSEPMNRPSVFRPSTTSRPFSRESAAQLIADLRRATDRLALETDPLFRFATLGAVESVVTELRRRADGGSRNLEPI